MLENSYNRKLEVYIYKKLAENGHKECKELDKLFSRYGRVHTNPAAYQKYSHIIWVVRMMGKIKNGWELKGNKSFTEEQYSTLKSYVDIIFS